MAMWTNEGPRLYYTKDKREIVKEGDPRAAFLLVGEGSQLPLEEAQRLGLVELQPRELAPGETLEAAELPAGARAVEADDEPEVAFTPAPELEQQVEQAAEEVEPDDEPAAGEKQRSEPSNKAKATKPTNKSRA